MSAVSPIGPDLVIAGAARSGTSSLAAQLAAHPAIDPGATKEPNYFSREFSRGPDWYDGLFHDRSPELLRMDASTSYTYPDFPEALARLAETSPDVFVVYLVRDPLPRAVSHYLLRRYTLKLEEGATFGEAMRASPYYAEVSDYSRWLPVLSAHVSPDRLLVVPFETVARSSQAVAAVICARLGLAPPPTAAETVNAHRNTVVEFRSRGVRRAMRSLRRKPFYPRLRAAVGASRVRDLRALLVRPARLPSPTEALASCAPEQLRELRAVEERAVAAARDYLVGQDARCGLDLAREWLPQPHSAERGDRLQ